jgi:hypothetical protein
MLGLAVLVLGGSFVFHSEWTIWKWLFYGVLVLAGLGWHRDLVRVWSESGVFRWAVWWVGWMLGVSFVRVGLSGNEVGTYESWCWGAAGLLAWLAMLHHLGRSCRLTDVLGMSVVGAAAVSAVVSVVHYGWYQPGWHWGMRLSNWMVYGGWNQVCSGVTYAFAAVWALLIGVAAGRGLVLRLMVGLAHGVLVFAALSSLSRGALLVLLAGHGALILLQLKPGLGGFGRFLVVFALFHGVMPELARTRDGASVPETKVSRRYPRVIDHNPLREWTKRADTGRLEIYREAGKAMVGNGVAGLLFGQGLWSESASWNQSLEDAPLHPHSVFVATALHGGVVGLAGLLAVLGRGLVEGWSAFRRKQWPLALVLSVAGLCGVIFDGHSLASLNSIPRFEPLLVWTGLLLGSGRLARVVAEQRGKPMAASVHQASGEA